MESVICAHFSQLVDHTYAPHITVEHTHVKILVVSALECQVS